MPDPKSIVVIIPAYNCEKWIQDSVESCLQPEVCRVVVVDDCSTDGTWNVLKQLANRDKVSAYRLDQNCGQYVATNRAIRELSGQDFDYYAFQDADDISAPDRFAKTLRAFEGDPSVHIVSGQMAGMNADGTPAASKGNKNSYENPDDPCLVLSKMFGHLLTHGVMTCSKEVIEVLGGFEPSYGGSDTQFIVRAYFAGFKMRNIPELLGYRRHHEAQATHRSSADPERQGFRNRCQGEYMWWKQLQKKGRLREHHLRSAAPAGACSEKA